MFRRLLCLALVPLALAACGNDKEKEEHEGLSDTSGALHVPVTISDAGCDPAQIKVQAGKIAFDVTNDGSSSVTEFYVLRANESIVGEVENVIPGKDKTLTLDLDEGDYITKCPNGDPEKGTLTVTNADSGENGTTSTVVTSPTPTTTTGGDSDPGADTGH